MTMTGPSPSLLRGLPALPRPRGPITVPRERWETYTAACPHGVDVEWVAVRDDARSHAVCVCGCPGTGDAA